jgi:hypothetical protein
MIGTIGAMAGLATDSRQHIFSGVRVISGGMTAETFSRLLHPL